MVSSSSKSTFAIASQLMPSSSNTSAFARRARRCAADPSRASSMRSCRDSLSRNPGRIIGPVESDSGRLARGRGPDSHRVGVYLNIYNIVEQDHRAIKRLVRPTLGFKSFWSAAITLAGIELMHMIRKGQLKAAGKLRPAQQFYSLAG